MGTTKKRAKGPKSPGGQRSAGAPAGPLLYVTSGGIGVDYSVPANVILASPGGVSELSGADIVALAYGVQSHPELGDLPSVSLICRNPTAARKAWEVFETWEKETDGDAVTLSWVFSSKGHYRLLIGADQDRIRFRLRGYDTTMRDLAVSSFYAKRFDGISRPTEEFRIYLRSWYSPFFFDARTESMKPIGKSLLKFHATESTEEALAPGSPERVILGLDERPERKGMPDADSTDWRAATLMRHFPVTLARLRRDDVAPILAEAAALGFQSWQVQQAGANLALSDDLSPGRPHYAALARHAAGDVISEGLRARHEIANGFDFARSLANGHLIRQLALDGNALLKSLGRPTTSSPEKVVARLRKAGLMEKTGHRGT